MEANSEPLSHIEQGWWPILRDELVQVCTQGLGRLGFDLVDEGVLAEEIAHQQVLSTLVGEVVGCDLLPGPIGDIPR